MGHKVRGDKTVVKNNHIYHQTWGILVTHMYFPIEVSFSLGTTEDNTDDIETGRELAEAKAHELLGSCIDTTVSKEFQYSFDLELEDEKLDATS